MQKINFQNLPNTTTPVNATNLNDLQDNVEDAINGIIDSGSNANGNYIKYDDGTMICWCVKEGNTFACTKNTTGRYYFSDTNNDTENARSWTYPVAFYSVPQVFVNVSSSAYAMTSCNNPTTTSVSGYCVLPYSVNSVKFTWNFLAIGKWK